MYSEVTLYLSILTFIFLVTANISTVNEQKISSDELKTVINEKYIRFAQFIKDRNPEELASSLYTKDAKFYPPNGGMVEGKEGVTKAFEGLINAGLIIEPEAQEVEIFGDHAYEYGIGSVYDRDGQKIREERYVCIWKRVDGEWKIYRDLVQGLALE